jgi:2-hydroxychromene-2-carboxylate isomerase
MPRPAIDFWFDFGSTYSYLAASRIGPLAAEAEVEVQFRPFLLGPIFSAQGWNTSPFNLYSAKGRNMWRDLERLAQDAGLAFRRPEPFPQNSLMAARVALIGLPHGWGERFCIEVFRAQFGDGRPIDQRATLAEILSRIGADPEAALAAAQADDNKNRLRAQTDEAQRLGVYGAPSFVTASGELFWGNDRLEQALRWAKRETGLGV